MELFYIFSKRNSFYIENYIIPGTKSDVNPLAAETPNTSSCGQNCSICIELSMTWRR